MENNTKLIESLFENATEYGKSSYELLKLKAVDKTSEVISTFVPQSVVLMLITVFMLFLNLGLAFWIGEILGKAFYGFFVVAAFYCISGIIVHFFLRTWLKKKVGNSIIKLLLK